MFENLPVKDKIGHRAPKYNPEIVFNTVLSLMEQGKFPIEVAAALNISHYTLRDWLRDPDKEEFRKVFDEGLTKCQAYWLARGREAIIGELKNFREATYKWVTSNQFGWAEKTQEVNDTDMTAISDEELDKLINKHLEKIKTDDAT